MFGLLQKLVAGIRQSPRRRTPTTSSRQFRPGVEGMEDRLVLSSNSLLAAGALQTNPTLLGQQANPGLFKVLNNHKPQRLFIPSLSQVQFTRVSSSLFRLIRLKRLLLAVPNLAGVSFNLKSDNPTVPDHQLDIQTQTYNTLGQASFTGLWSPAGQPQNAKPVDNGVLAWDAQGVHITFTWANGTHTFDGHITSVNGHWHIDGNTNAGPGHVSGDQI
jgi:hypothetical protein